MWDVWRNLFMEVADEHANRKIYKRNCMKNIAIQENNATAWERYKQARNDVNKETAKKQYFMPNLEMNKMNLRKNMEAD